MEELEVYAELREATAGEARFANYDEVYDVNWSKVWDLLHGQKPQVEEIEEYLI